MGAELVGVVVVEPIVEPEHDPAEHRRVGAQSRNRIPRLRYLCILFINKYFINYFLLIKIRQSRASHLINTNIYIYMM